MIQHLDHDTAADDELDVMSRLRNIYENLFGEPPGEDGRYDGSDSEYSSYTREQLVQMVSTARDRIGRLLDGESDL